VRALAASLSDDAPPASLDPDRLLAAVLAGLASVLPRLAGDDPALADRWADLDLLRGQTVRVDLGPRVVSGVAAGVDLEGALLIASEGETHRLFGGRVLRDVGPK